MGYLLVQSDGRETTTTVQVGLEHVRYILGGRNKKYVLTLLERKQVVEFLPRSVLFCTQEETKKSNSSKHQLQFAFCASQKHSKLVLYLVFH